MSKEKTYLGELEELILLLVMMLNDDAYGLSIRRKLKEEANRNVTIGAVHGTLNRLEKKGFTISEYTGATDLRGGRSKRVFKVTASGKKVLMQTQNVKLNIWKQIPELSIN